MVRLLGYSSRVGIDTDDPGPREIVRTVSTNGDSGWLIRFFDSSFFCEWIAVSYLYKHEHSGVRDYLCNRMYTLPISGIENYLFQLCYMLLHMPSPALEKYVVDMCSKSLRIAIKVHWFLLAESEDISESNEILRLQESCQMAAVMGDWPPLIKPQKIVLSPGKSRMFKLLSSRRILPLTTSPPQKASLPVALPAAITGDDAARIATDESESFMKVLKKYMPGPKVRDALFKKFREKDDEEPAERLPKDVEPDRFFRRFLFKEKEDEEKAGRNDDSEGFFRRLFKDKAEPENRAVGDDEEKDGFFKKLFRDRSEDRDRDRWDEEDRDLTSCEEDESGDFSIFRRFFRFHAEDEDKSAFNSVDSSTFTPENSPGHEGFFKKLFRERDRSVEDSRALSAKKEDGSPVPGSFLRRLFKERADEEALFLAAEGMKGLALNPHFNEGSDVSDKPGDALKVFPGIGGFQDDDYYRKSVPYAPRTDIYGFEAKGADSMDLGGRDMDDGYETEAPDNSVKDGQRNFDKTVPDPVNRKILFSPDPSKPVKWPGTPKRKPEKVIEKTASKPVLEKTSSKPPLPKYSSFRIRKGVYHATLDFVESLCDTSSGLVDVFPVEDRREALMESISELNAQLASAENDGGVCFPMGTGLARVVHIPEDEAVLLNSREKAPYLICLEVLRCDPDSSAKATKDSSRKGPRNGIPVANGDVRLPRPPPWAYSVMNQNDLKDQPNTEHYLKSASKAIDLAMAHLWEAKLKFVEVSFQVAPMKPPEDEGVMTRGTDVDGSAFCAPSSEGHPIQGIESRCCDGNLLLDSEEPRSQEYEHPHQSHSASHIFSSRVGIRTERSTESLEMKVCDAWVSVTLTAVPGLTMDDVVEEQPTKRREHRRVPSTIAMAEVTAAAAKGEAPAGLPVKKIGTGAAVTTPSKDTGASVPKATDALAGEMWKHKKERIRKASKFGSSPDWDLCSMIVKSGDDCRQEHLAVQLVSHFHDIFVEAGLPLWLRPYEVIVTSSHTALIETIPDTASIHAIKSRNPDLHSLRDFFARKYKEGSPALKQAQKNFVESMAGYSILCYLLQVKDRHNANLLIDEEGHIIHIDFGFMLYNSPGGVNFESAPFKLTRELLEVMDSDAEGTNSELFDYFKYLCIEGFLTCRKNAERIILLVEMMQDSGCPCFKGGQRTIQNLRKRFHLSLTEEQCVSLVLSLVNSSLDAWRTRQYDYYQRVLNGIL